MEDEIGTDLEVAVARSEKGDLERGKEEAMKERTARASLCQGKQLPRQRGEAETPMSNQPPRIDRGHRPVGARGAPNLTLGFAAKPSPSAPWARGLLSVSWEQGSPDLPTYGPWHG